MKWYEMMDVDPVISFVYSLCFLFIIVFCSNPPLSHWRHGPMASQQPSRFALVSVASAGVALSLVFVMPVVWALSEMMAFFTSTSSLCTGKTNPDARCTVFMALTFRHLALFDAAENQMALFCPKASYQTTVVEGGVRTYDAAERRLLSNFSKVVTVHPETSSGSAVFNSYRQSCRPWPPFRRLMRRRWKLHRFGGQPMETKQRFLRGPPSLCLLLVSWLWVSWHCVRFARMWPLRLLRTRLEWSNWAISRSQTFQRIWSMSWRKKPNNQSQNSRRTWASMTWEGIRLHFASSISTWESGRWFRWEHSSPKRWTIAHIKPPISTRKLHAIPILLRLRFKVVPEMSSSSIL